MAQDTPQGIHVPSTLGMNNWVQLIMLKLILEAFFSQLREMQYNTQHSPWAKGSPSCKIADYAVLATANDHHMDSDGEGVGN